MAYTQRTADYVIQKAYLHGRHKTAPAQTDSKYALLLSLVDSAQSDWASEPNVEWNSLYQRVTTGTVSTTDTYDLDDSLQYVSKREGDYVTLENTAGNRQRVMLVTGDQLYATRDVLACAQIGRQLVFSKPFITTSPYICYSIKVPGFIYTDDVTSPNSLIQCDDPLYLALMVAAEDIREDAVLSDQYNNLLDKAAERMDKLKQDNQGQMETLPTWQVTTGMTW